MVYVSSYDLRWMTTDFACCQQSTWLDHHVDASHNCERSPLMIPCPSSQATALWKVGRFGLNKWDCGSQRGGVQTDACVLCNDGVVGDRGESTASHVACGDGRPPCVCRLEDLQ